ncbi:duf1749 domain-containing protein [Bombardia bombarda]|uniref:Duf1749 domain-containing protein n=1 Tax=Bombardia bombarda TaxID=252184 RepID=A0AA39WTP0_9PEZI|nr:duf1749 domain-containing protein [Bombardia bombarda]
MANTFPVTVHLYRTGPRASRDSCAYEYGIPSSSPSPPPSNALIFIGGLGDGPHGVPYVRSIAKKLEASKANWSVFEVRLSSAYSGFGFGSLMRDVEEISYFVAYLRNQLDKTKAVLLGHSTGCQDCLEYSKHWANVDHVDGFILQGPVSDRESTALLMDKAEMDESVAHAAKMIAEGREDEFMPPDLLPVEYSTNPITAYRWHSLAAVGGDDDYFSSDLPDDRLTATWGGLEKPVLIVPSADDEHVPEDLDVAKLVEKWKSFCKPGIASELSGLIPGANHRVDDDDAREWLADRVAGFLASLE